MKDRQAWQALFPKFPPDRAAKALEILIESAAGLHKKHRSEREDLLTQRLRLRIRQNPSYKRSDLELHCQLEVYDPRDRDPELRGRLDLSFHLLKGRDFTLFHLLVAV